MQGCGVTSIDEQTAKRPASDRCILPVLQGGGSDRLHGLCRISRWPAALCAAGKQGALRRPGSWGCAVWRHGACEGCCLTGNRLEATKEQELYGCMVPVCGHPCRHPAEPCQHAMFHCSCTHVLGCGACCMLSDQSCIWLVDHQTNEIIKLMRCSASAMPLRSAILSRTPPACYRQHRHLLAHGAMLGKDTRCTTGNHARSGPRAAAGPPRAA